MIFVVSMVVVFAAVIGLCLFVLRRRGGAGERGARERAAAEQGFAQGLGGANATGQNAGPGGS
ncbi:hypothetical protein AB0H82_09660 [Streptomyces sp. NPDC050732]|uniref:hypothetical protein n=1 Tax=Streptomyces sp. NPDC050732 TaxID=3154632 RepID=UPI00342B77BF